MSDRMSPNQSRSSGIDAWTRLTALGKFRNLPLDIVAFDVVQLKVGWGRSGRGEHLTEKGKDKGK
jgi:hypothetical protein